MPFTPALQEYAEDRGDLPRLRLHAYKEGMRSRRLSGALKVAAGITTVNEVLRVAPESQ